MTETQWRRCETCGSHAKAGYEAYRVCEGHLLAGGNRDCRLVPCDDPFAAKPSPPDARTAALVEAARCLSEHLKFSDFDSDAVVMALRAALQPFEDAAMGRGKTP